LSLCLIASSPLLALSQHARDELEFQLRAKNYNQLGKLLRYEMKRSNTRLSEIEKIAEKEGSKPLIKAIQAATNFRKMGERFGISEGDFLEMALFLETNTFHGHTFLSKKKTGFACPLEHDASCKTTFIV